MDLVAYRGHTALKGKARAVAVVTSAAIDAKTKSI
jgi:hypothetical protein